ncbi:MAG TPA: flagellin [Candidatus Anaerobiospirillum stercoravium]|nr:flagellin [Candidatus Anaerobiospirillum stercoravium]
MAVYVNTNFSSLNGQRYLTNVQNSLNTTYTRLSSGLRINSAKDDAAGLQIADRLTSQINGLNQGNRNANDGIALAQTIEGGLDEISNMLQRMRTLAVQSANGTLGDDDRKAIQGEADQLAAEIQRIATETTFGGKTILSGYKNDGTTIYAKGDKVEVDDGQGGKLTAGCNAQLTLHVGANTGNQIEMSVYSFQFSRLASAAGLDEDTGYSKAADDTARIVLASQGLANKAISGIDKMIAIVDAQRADLGAIQNRLESSIRNQSNVSANSADARSRIRDADFAEESANLSQQSIIQQAATSMLMQANTRPQLALSMLG